MSNEQQPPKYTLLKPGQTLAKSDSSSSILMKIIRQDVEEKKNV
jgi:hypothetical protein